MKRRASAASFNTYVTVVNLSQHDEVHMRQPSDQTTHNDPQKQDAQDTQHGEKHHICAELETQRASGLSQKGCLITAGRPATNLLSSSASINGHRVSTGCQVQHDLKETRHIKMADTTPGKPQ
jgi:hypothetical protein